MCDVILHYCEKAGFKQRKEHRNRGKEKDEISGYAVPEA